MIKLVHHPLNLSFMPQGEVLNVKRPPAQFSKQILQQLINLLRIKIPD